MKNNFKMMFMILMFISTMFLMTSISWLNMWIWLEINLISFISLMINNNMNLSIESSLIYFLIQSIASIMFLFSIFMLKYKNMIFMFILSMMLKLGSAPIHFWVPLMIEGINWIKIFLMLTWQKINPLIMIIMINYFLNLNIFIFFSLIIGSISGLNYSSLKKMISFSSINQLSWIFLSLNNNKLFKIFMMFYLLLMWMVIKSLKLFNLKFINQMFNLKMKNKFMKLFIFMNFLSLGGLPPFMGFFPKMFIIFKINNLMMFLMIIFTLISLFIYLRIIYSLLVINSKKMNKMFEMKNYFKSLSMMKFSIMNNLFLILLMFMI